VILCPCLIGNAVHEITHFLCLETIPKRVTGGYVCDLCPRESRPVLPDRPALWIAELFEPFLAWVNGDLAKAKWLALHGSPDDAAWARLLADDTPSQTLRGGGLLLNQSAWVEGRARREKSSENRPILLPCRAPRRSPLAAGAQPFRRLRGRRVGPGLSVDDIRQ
jgi:hypothetical protein